jgi:hypothetical protein
MQIFKWVPIRIDDQLVQNQQENLQNGDMSTFPRGSQISSADPNSEAVTNISSNEPKTGDSQLPATGPKDSVLTSNGNKENMSSAAELPSGKLITNMETNKSVEQRLTKDCEDPTISTKKVQDENLEEVVTEAGQEKREAKDIRQKPPEGLGEQTTVKRGRDDMNESSLTPTVSVDEPPVKMAKQTSNEESEQVSGKSSSGDAKTPDAETKSKSNDDKKPDE